VYHLLQRQELFIDCYILRTSQNDQQLFRSTELFGWSSERTWNMCFMRHEHKLRKYKSMNIIFQSVKYQIKFKLTLKLFPFTILKTAANSYMKYHSIYSATVRNITDRTSASQYHFKMVSRQDCAIVYMK